MEYTDKLVCFIDILGFKKLIDESVTDSQKLDSLYQILSRLNPDDLKKKLLGNTLTWGFNGNEAGLAKYDLNDKLISDLNDDWPLEITQFSDSFVISCPADNAGSICLFLDCIEYLKNAFFSQEIILRGGVSVGKLIHQSNKSVLFGPAMNEAYYLESTLAIYPRIVISTEAYGVLDNELHGNSKFQKLIGDSFDGHKFFDLVSLFDTNCQLNHLALKTFLELKNSSYPKVDAKYNYIIQRYNKTFNESISFI